MCKELLLHIGSHKTGTTTVQHWLRNNIGYLREQGYCFPSALAVEGHNHSPLAEEVRTKDGAFIYWHRLFKEVENNPKLKYILSSENFSDLRHDDIKKLKELIDLNFDSVHIYFAARHPFHAVVSHWGLLLKQGLTDCDFASFVTNGYFATNQLFDLKKYNYEFILQPWINFFGRDALRVIHYEEGKDSLFKMLNAFSINTNLVKSSTNFQRKNVFPCGRSLYVMLYANRALQLNKELSLARKQVISATIYTHANEIYREDADKFDPLDAQSLRILKAYYGDSIEWLRQNFGINLQAITDATSAKITSDLAWLSTSELKYWNEILIAHMDYVDS